MNWFKHSNFSDTGRVYFKWFQKRNGSDTGSNDVACCESGAGITGNPYVATFLEEKQRCMK